jgi:long-chain acyl-CoA synthetase
MVPRGGPVNLASIIDEHAPDATALIFNNRVTSYGELRDEVARCRGGLRELGVESGDRVAVMCSNGVPFVVVYLAALGLGAVTVPLNPTSPAPELQCEIAVVGAKVVVVERSSAATWANVDRETVPSVRAVVSTDPAASHPTAASSDVVPFDRLLSSEPVERIEVSDDHLAVLIFTSGTAGSPRAAMLTHGNLLSNIEQGLSATGHFNGDDVIYGVLPLFHIFGLNVVLGLGLRVGATVLLVQRFDPATAAESIQDRHITVVPGAPALWAAFAQLDDLPADTFSTVRLALSGASRLPVTVAETMLERFGVEIREGYGLTEASPIVTTSTGAPVRFGSVGRALSGVEVRLVGINGDALVGDVGEVWVRGDNVFAGYLDDPEATAAVFSDDGWLRTGDMAIADDDGYMYLVDRVKDLIIVSGFNVYPAEVEEMLVLHPEIAEVGVIGVPHPHTGEAVKAYVVVQPGSLLDEETVIDFALDHLARYKCPSKVIFVESLPRNASGKLVRRSLDDALRVGMTPAS